MKVKTGSVLAGSFLRHTSLANISVRLIQSCDQVVLGLQGHHRSHTDAFGRDGTSFTIQAVDDFEGCPQRQQPAATRGEPPTSPSSPSPRSHGREVARRHAYGRRRRNSGLHRGSMVVVSEWEMRVKPNMLLSFMHYRVRRIAPRCAACRRISEPSVRGSLRSAAGVADHLLISFVMSLETFPVSAPLGSLSTSPLLASLFLPFFYPPIFPLAAIKRLHFLRFWRAEQRCQVEVNWKCQSTLVFEPRLLKDT